MSTPTSIYLFIYHYTEAKIHRASITSIMLPINARHRNKTEHAEVQVDSQHLSSSLSHRLFCGTARLSHLPVLHTPRRPSQSLWKFCLNTVGMFKWCSTARTNPEIVQECFIKNGIHWQHSIENTLSHVSRCLEWPKQTLNMVKLCPTLLKLPSQQL